MSYLDGLITADDAQRAHANRFGVEEGQYRNLQRMRQADREAALDRQERDNHSGIIGGYMQNGLAPPLQPGPALGRPTARAPAATPAPAGPPAMRVAPDGAPDPTVSPWRGRTAQTPLTADESARQVAAEQARLQQLRSQGTPRPGVGNPMGDFQGDYANMGPSDVDNGPALRQSEARLAALKSESAARQQMKPAPSDARGMRNNNPGNIVKSNIDWQGKVQGADPRFETFATMEDGVRALQQNLLTYQEKHGLNTPQAIISRWAPASENNTAAYVQAVSTSLGVQPNQPINLRDPATMQALTQAIIRHENGPSGTANRQPAVQTAQAPAVQPAAQPTPGKPEYDRGQTFMPEQAAANNERRNQIAQQYEMLQRLGNATRDPGKKLQALQQMNALQGEAAEMELSNHTTAAAQGSTQHLTALVQLASQSTGAPFGVADAGNGQVVFVRNGRDGQPVYSPPMAMPEAAGQLKLLLSSQLQAKRAEQENVFRMELMKWRGKAEGEEPSKIREEGAKAYYAAAGEASKADSARQLAEINNNADMAQKMVQLGIERQNLRFTASPVNDGSGVLTDGTGRVFEYKPGGRDPRYPGVVMESTIKQVQ